MLKKLLNYRYSFKVVRRPRISLNYLNFPDSFKIVKIFPDLKAFRTVSKLSGSLRMTSNPPFSFKTIQTFPDNFKTFFTVSGQPDLELSKIHEEYVLKEEYVFFFWEAPF